MIKHAGYDPPPGECVCYLRLDEFCPVHGEKAKDLSEYYCELSDAKLRAEKQKQLQQAKGGRP